MMAYLPPSSDKLAEVICPALGLRVEEIQRLTIDLQPSKPIDVYVQMCGSHKLLQVDWMEHLKGVQIREVDKE
jgi:hypothetical protein